MLDLRTTELLLPPRTCRRSCSSRPPTWAWRPPWRGCSRSRIWVWRRLYKNRSSRKNRFSETTFKRIECCSIKSVFRENLIAEPQLNKKNMGCSIKIGFYQHELRFSQRTCMCCSFLGEPQWKVAVLMRTSVRFSRRTDFMEQHLGLPKVIFPYWESVFQEDLFLYNWSLEASSMWL